jgi:hypothetical protein
VGCAVGAVNFLVVGYFAVSFAAYVQHFAVVAVSTQHFFAAIGTLSNRDNNRKEMGEIQMSFPDFKDNPKTTYDSMSMLQTS